MEEEPKVEEHLVGVVGEEEKYPPPAPEVESPGVIPQTTEEVIPEVEEEKKEESHSAVDEYKVINYWIQVI